MLLHLMKDLTAEASDAVLLGFVPPERPVPLGGTGAKAEAKAEALKCLATDAKLWERC